MGKNTSDKTRNSLLATTLFPPRFGRSQEFAKLCQGVIENGYLNGTGKLLRLFFRFPYESGIVFGRGKKANKERGSFSDTVIRIDGGGRMAKM